MTDHDVLVFLLALAALLGLASLLGEIARVAGLPLVVGELAAGVLLGPTVLGHLTPRGQASLFPRTGPAQAMIGAYTTVAVVLLLVVGGLEVDLGVLRRPARSPSAPCLPRLVLPPP